MKTYKEYKDMGRFNEGQMEEIRLGLEKDIDVSIYAKPEYKSYAMRHDASENLLVNL